MRLLTAFVLLITIMPISLALVSTVVHCMYTEGYSYNIPDIASTCLAQSLVLGAQGTGSDRSDPKAYFNSGLALFTGF